MNNKAKGTIPGPTPTPTLALILATGCLCGLFTEASGNHGKKKTCVPSSLPGTWDSPAGSASATSHVTWLCPPGLCFQTQILRVLTGTHGYRLKWCPSHSIPSGSKFLLFALIKHFLRRHKRMILNYLVKFLGGLAFLYRMGVGRLFF